RRFLILSAGRPVNSTWSTSPGLSWQVKARFERRPPERARTACPCARRSAARSARAATGCRRATIVRRAMEVDARTSAGPTPARHLDARAVRASSMRLLVLSNLFPPEAEGGLELSCFEACLGLQQRGHRVEVITQKERLGRPHAEPLPVHRILDFS